MKLKDLFEAEVETENPATEEKELITPADINSLINQKIKPDLIRKIKDHNEKNDNDPTRVSGTNARAIKMILGGNWASERDQLIIVATLLARNGLRATIDPSSIYKKI